MKQGRANKLRGLRFEQLAQQYLIEQGLQHVQSNYNTPMGEIDLIMRDGTTLVFVEVRYRKNACFGGPLASISPQKIKRLIRAAESYCQKFRQEPACRFDVIAITPQENSAASNQPTDIQWIQDAFQAVGYNA